MCGCRTPDSDKGKDVSIDATVAFSVVKMSFKGRRIRRHWPKVALCVFLLYFISRLLAKRRKINDFLFILQLAQEEVSPEVLMESEQFENIVKYAQNMTGPPGIVFTNYDYANLTLNFLCNVAAFGAQDRLILVNLDPGAARFFRQAMPSVAQVHWPFSYLQKRPWKPISSQILFSFRINLAAALTRQNVSFWMLQQDTIWSENLFSLHLEDGDDFDILFDSAGYSKEQEESHIITGANWFVKGNKNSSQYFSLLSERYPHWYAYDVALMRYQCFMRQPKGVRCNFMPFRISAQGAYIVQGHDANFPVLLQMDFTGNKLGAIEALGFSFLSQNNSCATKAPNSVKTKRKLDRSLVTQLTGDPANTWPMNSVYGRTLINIYYYISKIPIAGRYFEVLCPLFSWYLL